MRVAAAMVLLIAFPYSAAFAAQRAPAGSPDRRQVDQIDTGAKAPAETGDQDAPAFSVWHSRPSTVRGPKFALLRATTVRIRL